MSAGVADTSQSACVSIIGIGFILFSLRPFALSLLSLPFMAELPRVCEVRWTVPEKKDEDYYWLRGTAST